MIKIVAGFFVVMVMITVGTVYSLKGTVEQLEARKHQLSAKILKDRSAIKVLRAEMAYLSQPERLQKLSRRFLALSPARSTQMAASVNSIAGRGGVKFAALPVDEFPLLLPQEKPHFEKKKYNIVAVSYPAPQKLPPKLSQKKAAIGKASFYERISLKLGEGK